MIKTYILNETTLKHYINYNKEKDLNIKIAAQTLSGSVADAIEFFIAIKNSIASYLKFLGLRKKITKNEIRFMHLFIFI